MQNTQSAFRILRITLALILSALFLNACDSPAHVDPRTARVSEIINIVEARVAQQPAFAPATIGLTLVANGQVRTAAASKARLDFSEGSLVRLSEKTMLTVEELAEDSHGPISRFRLTLGKIWVSVFNRTFELETPVGVATVRGSFAVFEVLLENPADPTSLKLIMDCLEGDCTAKNDVTDRRFGNLERIEMKKTSPQIVPQPAPPEALLEFLSNNREAQSQQILPTLTAAAPQLTRTRELSRADATPTVPLDATATPITRTIDIGAIITRTVEIISLTRTPTSDTKPTLTPTPLRTISAFGTRVIETTPVFRETTTPATILRTPIPIIEPIITPIRPIEPTKAPVPTIKIEPTRDVNIPPTLIHIEPTKNTITNPTATRQR